jgi:hypothetical protein
MNAPRTILVVLALLATEMATVAQQPALKEIKIPYSLSWGDNIDKVREMINAVKAHEISRVEKPGGKVVMEAEGLNISDLLLKKSLFTFKDGSLVEVELQYDDPAWDAEKTVDFFDRTRRRIDERYGLGTLLVNRVKEHPESGGMPKETTYTLIIYQWCQPTVSLELNYYSFEELEKHLRIVSLHYKTP